MESRPLVRGFSASHRMETRSRKKCFRSQDGSLHCREWALADETSSVSSFETRGAAKNGNHPNLSSICAVAFVRRHPRRWDRAKCSMACLDEGCPERLLERSEQLDRQSAQAVLDSSKKVKLEVSELVVEAIHRHTITDKFKDEEVASNRVYPPTYRVRPIEAQVTALKAIFPVLGDCHEKLARKPLLEGAEAWFAIPRWQALAPDVQRGGRRDAD